MVGRDAREGGAMHEPDYVDYLPNSGYAVALLDGVGAELAIVEKTTATMKAGREIDMLRMDGLCANKAKPII
jgi:hypothetical protein